MTVFIVVIILDVFPHFLIANPCYHIFHRKSKVFASWVGVGLIEKFIQLLPPNVSHEVWTGATRCYDQ